MFGINEKNNVTVQSNLQNATHFGGVAYPPNKISKNRLKNASIFRLFYEILLGSEQLQNNVKKEQYNWKKIGYNTVGRQERKPAV